MSRIKTPALGISTTSTYDDGECVELVNMRHKNGILKPVSPRKVKQSMMMYDIVFVHKTSTYENYIGVTNDTVTYNGIPYDEFFVKSDVRDSDPIWINYRPNERTGTIKEVQQIGNTLSLIAENEIYYMVFLGGKYTFLGALPNLPKISFNTTTKSGDSQSNATWSVRLKYSDYYDYSSNYNLMPQEHILNSTKGLVNIGLNQIKNEWSSEVLLTDAHLVRWAFRLYDGSIVKCSPPILLMPQENILTHRRTYQVFDRGMLVTPSSYIYVSGYSVEAYVSGMATTWSDIIESIDIFLSPPIGVLLNDNIEIKGVGSAGAIYNLIPQIPSGSKKALSEMSNFYYLKSVKIQNYSSTVPLTQKSDISISDVSNLIYQELMPDSGHNKIGAKESYVYNNRLHIANILTTFFKGFSPGYFFWSTHKSSSIPYNGYTGYPYFFQPGVDVIFEIELNVGSDEKYCYAIDLLSNHDYSAKQKLLNPYLSYPDSRAKKLSIYQIVGQTTYKLAEYNLRPHAFLDIAYYIDPNLLPAYRNEQQPPIYTGTIDTSASVRIIEQNKIKVSELNNPFYFPNKQTYMVGDGSILALASNMMNVSDRNYGQYPLYVFTDKGVWTMNTGTGDVVYSTLSNPAYLEAAINGIVCSTPYGVVFSTKRGLCVINGQQVRLISEVLEDDGVAYSIQMPSQVQEQLLGITTLSMKKYLQGLSFLIYNPLENEVIAVNKSVGYNYVHDFDSKSFWQSTEKVDLVVGNTFPEVLVIADNKLKDYSQAETDMAKVVIVTRPIRYSNDDVKVLVRTILRGLIFNTDVPENKKPVIMISHSDDGVNFYPTKGIALQKSNLKDIDMGMFAKTKYRQFVLTFAGTIKDKSQIQYLESDVHKEYEDSKMR